MWHLLQNLYKNNVISKEIMTFKKTNFFIIILILASLSEEKSLALANNYRKTESKKIKLVKSFARDFTIIFSMTIGIEAIWPNLFKKKISDESASIMATTIYYSVLESFLPLYSKIIQNNRQNYFKK